MHTCSPTQRSTWVSPSPWTSGQVARALPLALTKLLDPPVTRRRRRRVWADAGRGYADTHVQRLPCGEVLQPRSPKDGFEKGRIGRESDNGTAQGYLLSAPQVARCGQRRRVAGLVHFGTGGVSAARECAMPQGRRGSARGSSLVTEVQGMCVFISAAPITWASPCRTRPRKCFEIKRFHMDDQEI